MKNMRWTAVLLAAGLLAPGGAAAQLTVLPPCYPGASTCSPFGFELSSALRPIELANLSFDLGNGWRFGGGPVDGSDLFGPFPFAPGSFAYGAGFASLQIDFLAALYGPAAPEPGCGLDLFFPCEGFAVRTGFGPPTYIAAGLDGPAGLHELAFDWRATDIDGTQYDGRVGTMVSVPEPATAALLVAGLLGMGVMRRRRGTAPA